MLFCSLWFGLVRQSASDSHVFISSRATSNTEALLPTTTVNPVNVEAHISSQLDIASSPMDTTELPHFVRSTSTTVRYVLKDYTMVPEFGLDFTTNIFHIPPHISPVISSSATTN